MVAREPDPKGEDVARGYFDLSREHGRQGLIEYRNRRRNKSDEHTRAMKRLQRAAIAERDDPVPEDLWYEPPKRLPPPAQPPAEGTEPPAS